MELACRIQGHGTPVVILHGLFGNGRNWAGIAKRLSAHHRVCLPDLPHHGDSPWRGGLAYPAQAEAVAGFLTSHRLDGAALIGHSMGGKVAMTLALTRPALVGRLAVVDVAPVAYPPPHGDDHRAAAQAMRDLAADGTLAATSRRADLAERLAEAVPEPAVRAFLTGNTRRDGDGLAWGVDVDQVLADLPDLVGFPELPGHTAFSGPTLFLAGGRSPYLKTAHHAAIHARFPHARRETIPEAGHWPHSEQPDAVLGHLAPFLATS
ncbi:alpha/beta fold hydrolase [Roseospirillum parvum]|uniref:Pimeloyl-ACP methyl ester carboxylesterase n=1 Tax=Roseospirillum parvum TaxID=83401 RepID=A0A1G7ZQB3_9PROT|nr:alpha/beta fold hydrolase [Roseospirillum parvum]SDH10942.1 Pimeloyl-ACP methyl ester carboxylesterase [Roseospirillum parvum]